MPTAKDRFDAYLAAFNAGDRSKLVAFHTAYWPYPKDDPGVDGELRFRSQTGGFEVKKVETATPTHAEIVVKEHESDQFARAVIDIEALAPHKVTKFELQLISTPPGMGPARMTEAEAIAALRAELDTLTATDKFSGTVILAKHGTPIFSGAYGLADREHGIKNTLDTRFRIGSMNKMFTAVGAIQLVQAKQLAVTDALVKVLPAYPNAQLASKVTIHHLLTHTGGTGDIFGPEFDKHRKELRTLDDYVKLYGTRDLEFEPGAKWVYSNYGFLLAGVVIEAVSKQTYYDYVHDHVFVPAGMTSTSSPLEDEPNTDLKRSIGYMRDGATLKPNTDTLPIRATSAGGGDSTVGDLLAFANALTANKLLDAEHTELVTTGKVETPGKGKYAYGFLDEVQDGVRCFGHGGGAPGMNGALSICSSGYTIAVLANLDPPAAGRVEQFALARLPLK
jgi:CubicO group peptidase (beta-lactamase class C family)